MEEGPMTDQTPIRVMIVDDHPMVRDGLRVFLNVLQDMEFVAEASNGQDAVRLCTENEPDVILMDLKMPGMDGVEATQFIRRRHPRVQVIALTSFADEALVHKAMQAGAIGYLLKDVPAEELAEAIRNAYAGRPTLAPAAAQALIQATTPSMSLGHDLTPREREVLALLVEGMSNAQIADELTVSPATVNYHVGNILSKLGAANRTEAATLAIQHHLIAGPDS
jgi:NarL family two-component system response regulator LiaR